MDNVRFHENAATRVAISEPIQTQLRIRAMSEVNISNSNREATPASCGRKVASQSCCILLQPLSQSRKEIPIEEFRSGSLQQSPKMHDRRSIGYYSKEGNRLKKSGKCDLALQLTALPNDCTPAICKDQKRTIKGKSSTGQTSREWEQAPPVANEKPKADSRMRREGEMAVPIEGI